MMKNSEWNNLRARYHHDWLKNRYLIFLGARAEYMDVAIRNSKGMREDILKQFTEWEDKSNDLNILIRESIGALSPVQLFNEYPLKQMPDESKVWLKDIISALYIENTNIQNIQTSLQDKYRSISECYKIMKKVINNSTEESRKRAGNNPVASYFKELQELSRLISMLPHEIQIV